MWTPSHPLQVRRLLPDPPSLRGVSYLQPTIPLTDEILRPSSAPPSPKTVVVGAEQKQQVRPALGGP